MNSMTGRNYKIEVFTSLEKIAPRWMELEHEGHASPFQSHAWCRALHSHIGHRRGARPCIVVIADTISAKDVMLLPLMLGPDGGGRRRISFFDFGVSDYSAPVTAAGFTPDAGLMRKLWRRILEQLPKADYLQFTKLPENPGDRPNPLLNVLETQVSTLKSYDLDLPENWSDYHLKSLSHRMRKNLRQRWRKLKTEGKTGLLHGDTPQRALEIFNILLRQRQERFAALKREEILNRPEYVDFYRALITDPLSPGVITALTVDEKIIAVLYGLVYKGRYTMLLSSFEGAEWAQHSPGLLVIEAMMQWLHGNGIGVYDFTIGSEPYKRKLGGREHNLYECMLPFTLTGRTLGAASSARRGIKSLLGKI